MKLPTDETRHQAALLLIAHRENYDLTITEMAHLMGYMPSDIKKIEFGEGTDSQVMNVMRMIGHMPSINVGVTVSVPRGTEGQVRALSAKLNMQNSGKD